MESLKINSNNRIVFFSFSIIMCLFSCNKDLLNEKPLSSLNADITLTSKAGFDAYLIGLVREAREEYTQDDNTYFITNFPGTDVGEDAGAEYFTYRNWVSYLTPIRSEVKANWSWAYKDMLPQANTIIVYANKAESKKFWETEAEKNAVIAEARFFRGYTYNFLANLYGGVPIVDTISNSPKFDYQRATRQKVYEFAKADLQFASQWLPETVPANKAGRIVKAAADHLLTEVNISLGNFDSAIASANRVINSGLYKLMTSRFGNQKDAPGDVYSDLFIDGNQNRSSGNLESIYVWQIEDFTEGGGGTRNANAAIRNMAPFLVRTTDPAGVSGFVPSDSLGRGVGRVRGTNYSLYSIWKDASDIRNSQYNFRRNFYYNNPKSSFLGKQVGPRSTAEDTLRSMYPYPRKIEGKPWHNDRNSGSTAKDIYVYRLSETYLLRSEAYFRKGEIQKATDDINTVRLRSNAQVATPGEVNLDYILDERARELMYEEPRRRTLIRMGLLVERVKKYGLMESWLNTIQDRNNLWPIPQEAIDANFGAELKQNPGY